ncbi:hypothetical protein HBE96_23685 [Clostridium sp. P21]|uniref:Uncharacterized protein n=1 Tax=Clostridium muellerianum TaxID=2716538 RepID=A0A7Y0HS86_9CLOT|nr:hypothetical protein [Clostridium muellerianum]NMM65583.1 hypothetical protein [Clostridium muellerianum]
MGIISKISKISNIVVSSTKEKVKCKYLERNIKSLNNRIKDTDDKKAAHLIIEKENMQKKIEEEKINESERRKKITVELKKQVEVSNRERKEEVKHLNTVQKVKKEFEELPIATAVDDLVSGISDIEKAQELVKKSPENIYVWLNLAETIKFHKKAFLIINGIKAPWDMIGSTIDLTMEFVGGAIEDNVDKNKWTYERAINQAIKLGATRKQIREFAENYKKNIVISGVKGTSHMILKQGKKLTKTSERIIDFAADKFILKNNKK